MTLRVSTGFWLVASGFCLFSTGCAPIERAGTLTRQTIEMFVGDTALKAVQMMENERFPDQRRKGINKLVERDYGKRDPYTQRYAQIARNDEDFLVRATAIRALNRARHRPATPVFIEALSDDHPMVRLEAAKALANVPDPNAAAPLVGAVNNSAEDRDVRIAAADALRHYKQLDVARALALQLGEKGDFSVAWQARRSLRKLTGRDMRYDQSAWLGYLSATDQPFG
ncbi:MAG TPA: HEAT repeat domain-containing protein [Tepidisphaeraceae bacterium]|nr:HEAT repeat domain-containing protein [Tepidisphaeraceae bacterium]